MNELYQRIYQAQVGQIVPLVQEIDITCPVDFFARISDYGRKEHCFLLESKDYLTDGDGGELTFGAADPALYLTGQGNAFSIVALTPTGLRMIDYFRQRPERFSFCQTIDFQTDKIVGTLKPNHGFVDEESRLKSINQMDVLRAVGFAFQLASKPFRVTCGLVGAISYDFIDQFEQLPPSKTDALKNPDYELYFADNIFLLDHRKGKGCVIVNAIITDHDRQQIAQQTAECFESYYQRASAGKPTRRHFHANGLTADTDTPQDQFEAMVKKAQEHIRNGDIFQVVLSRTLRQPCPAEPLDVYRQLRKLNPSPYMFYIHTPNTTLMGASPELNLRVSGGKDRIVQIRPIAGTKPRGRVDGKIDPDLDMRYEAELKLDRKELAEHMMLVDLARNDIARVAQPGSRIVNELLITERYESVMHLVSNVKGKLRREFDALSAYLATMNMGTLTGAPKIEAMKIIRQLEQSKRGYYGGAVMYLTVDGQFDSGITIRSLQIKDQLAYVRAGAGIVFDSRPESEFLETQHKAQSCLKAIQMAIAKAQSDNGDNQ